MSIILRSPLLLVAGLVVFAARPATAQPPHPADVQRGRGPAGVEAPYDPATEVTLRGTVQEVKPMNTVVTVTHVMLNADHATVDVHLGPSSWVAKQSVSFNVGDQIEVIGSRVKYAGADVVVARQIRKSGQTLTLRDTQGISKWSRGSMIQGASRRSWVNEQSSGKEGRVCAHRLPECDRSSSPARGEPR